MTTHIPDHNGLLRALHAVGPTEEHVEKLMLFGQFVGSWAADWSGTSAQGETIQLAGEVHFGWILGGRAIQDTWIVPGAHTWEESRPPVGFYGTTIRFYDPSLAAWRSIWIDPPNGIARRFIARQVHEEIVLLSDEESPHLRWRFTEITPQSFRWQAEISHDAGSIWSPHQDIRLHRASP